MSPDPSAAGAPTSAGGLISPSHVESLAEGLALAAGSRILDARDADTFARGHPEGAGRLGASELVTRRMELPARERPVLVVHEDPAAAREVAEALAARGFTRVAWLSRPVSQVAGGLASREPAARLWSTSAFVERVCAPLARGRALDLACGTGRAAVWLALAGWRVEAWDVDESALRLATAFAVRQGAELLVRAVDLERAEPPA